MTIKDDRDELWKTGIYRILSDLMSSADSGFVRVHPGGWDGELVAERPAPGSGPFIEYRRGYPLLRHANAPQEQTVEEYRIPRI